MRTTAELIYKHDKAKFYQGDLADQDFMRKVFTENPEIDAVIHFAAYSLVAESMKKPLKYFDNNDKFCPVCFICPTHDLFHHQLTFTIRVDRILGITAGRK